MRTQTILALGLAMLACHDGSNTAEPVVSDEPELAIIEDAPAPTLPGVALVSGHHRGDVVDIILAPDASAALTLDRDGGVRLWPALDGSRDPLILPIDDPNQLSFARSETGFVIASLDTIGAAEVYAVRDHDGELRLDVLFSRTPEHPMFELHVLDGGKRLIGLGVDHRICLYDELGNELSAIAEHGFVPWQLRHTKSSLVAVLAGPTRVQRLSLKDDHLQIVGDPLPVELDRGPNRNDLALTPDGKHIAAFSRRKWRRGEWKLQLIALADGSENIIEGKLDTEARPRVHILEGQRMLLDDGTGVGQMISLNPAAPGTSIRPLPGSSEPTRLFTSIEHGVRVVPSGDGFIVDHLDGESHLRLGRVQKPMRGAGISPDATRVVWAMTDGWATESLTSSTMNPTIHPHTESPLLAAEFVDDGRVVLVAQDGQIELVHAETGEQLASTRAPLLMTTPHITEARVARGETAMLLVRDMSSKLDMLIEIGSDGFTARSSTVAEAPFVGPWSPVEMPDAWISTAWTRPDWWSAGPSEQALETELASLVSRQLVDIRDLVTLPDGARVFAAGSSSQLLIRTHPSITSQIGNLQALHERAGFRGVGRLLASPTGHRVAALHDDGSISLHDALSLEREWTRTDTHATALGWSSDGNRLVVVGERGGAVLDTETGDVEFERRDFGLHVERVHNSMPSAIGGIDPLQ